MNPFVISLLLIVGLSSFVWILYGRTKLLLSLKKESRSHFLWERVKVFFDVGIGQKHLIRRKKERSSGWMHAFIFWGFCILSLRTLTLVGEGFIPGFHFPLLGDDFLFGYLYIFLKDIVEGLVLFMILYAAYRRLFVKPTRLDTSGEALFVLWMIGMLMATDLFYDGARFNLIQKFGNPDQIHWFQNTVYGSEWSWTPVANLFAWWIQDLNYMQHLIIMHFSYWVHMTIVLLFLCFLPLGKHFHVITALPNVFFSSIGYPHTKLKKMDLEDEKAWEEESIGVNHIHQLTWKQGLDLYTCTECGRCKEVCPTYVTKKPLDLKTFNDSLKQEMYQQQENLIQRNKLQHTLEKIQDESKKDSIQQKINACQSSNSLVGDVIHPDTLWACTTCRACEQVCPVGIEHVPRILEMRQGQTLMAEAHPSELNTAFKGLERNANPWGVGYDKRADWAKGLDITTMAENSNVDYLLWVGCAGAFDDRGQKVARATAQLLKIANVSFSILGIEEKCTGDFARRSGNEMLFQMMAEDNVNTLNEYEVKKIITTCPHCLNTLDHEYPEFGGNYELIHHTSFIFDLIRTGKIKIDSTLEKKVTYHDPCYLGRYNKVYNEPRNVLQKITTKPIEEMERNREESFCCGAGGARMWMEETIGKRINIERVEEAAKTDADVVAVACPFCLTMVEDGIKSIEKEASIKTMDVAEIVLQSLSQESKTN